MVKVQMSQNLWNDTLKYIDQLEAEIANLNDMLARERKYIEDLYQLRDYTERLCAGGYRG